MSPDDFQNSSRSGSRKLRNCNNLQKSQKFAEFVDVESVDDDIVIMEAPKTSCRRSRTFASPRNTCPSVIVITIDDDDDDEGEYEEVANTSLGKNGRASPENYNFRSNCYGFGPVSDAESCNTSNFQSSGCDEVSIMLDDSDCEILSDTSGSLREQWENAASKKRMRKRMRKDGHRWSEGTSGTMLEKESNNCSEELLNSGVQLKENLLKKCNQEHGEHDKFGCKARFAKHYQFCDSSVRGFPCQIHTDAQCGCSNSSGKQDQALSDVDSKRSDHLQDSLETEIFTGEFNGDINSMWAHKGGDYPVSEERSVPLNDVDYAGKKVYVPIEASMQIPNDIPFQTRRAATQDMENQTVDMHSIRISDLNHEPANVSFVPDNLDYCAPNAAPNEDATDIAETADVGRNCNNTVYGLGNATNLVSEGILHGSECDLICPREKHKESTEYMHAMEEEWASRKRELIIQAEEAQRLRRRRKAESLRLCEMERRQKQRLEEIRESERKNEETVDLKDRLRLEIRKELLILEGLHKDMASILRALGIHVEGDTFPTIAKVKAAYKQALLRFHPDRVLKNDIREQVKAEETFKFISRLKDKLLPVS